MDATTEISPTLTPQQTAEYVRDGMFARDRAAHGLKMRITHIAPGQATIKPMSAVPSTTV